MLSDASTAPLPRLHETPPEQPAVPGQTRAVRVASEIVGCLLALEEGWRFHSLRRRFDALDCGLYRRAEDAECAARGIEALASRTACACRPAPSRGLCHPLSPERQALLRAFDTVLERDAA
jgi:hypothetical protein